MFVRIKFHGHCSSMFGKKFLLRQKGSLLSSFFPLPIIPRIAGTFPIILVIFFPALNPTPHPHNINCVSPDTPWTPFHLTLEHWFYIMRMHKRTSIMSCNLSVGTLLVSFQNYDLFPRPAYGRNIRSSFETRNEYCITTLFSTRKVKQPEGGIEPHLNGFFKHGEVELESFPARLL
jgi:hypothetical protein